MLDEFTEYVTSVSSDGLKNENKTEEIPSNFLKASECSQFLFWSNGEEEGISEPDSTDILNEFLKIDLGYCISEGAGFRFYRPDASTLVLHFWTTVSRSNLPEYQFEDFIMIREQR